MIGTIRPEAPNFRNGSLVDLQCLLKQELSLLPTTVGFRMIAIFDAIYDFFMDVPNFWVAFKRQMMLLPIAFILPFFEFIHPHLNIIFCAYFVASIWLSHRAIKQKRAAR